MLEALKQQVYEANMELPKRGLFKRKLAYEIRIWNHNIVGFGDCGV